MKKNLTELSNKTNDGNIISPKKTKINKKMTIEYIDRIINEGKTIYWCEDAIYGKRKVLSKDRIKFKDKEFLATGEIKGGKMKALFICSFYKCGHGFFLERKDFAESLQIYKATRDRDYYYTINELTDKNKQNTKTNTVVYTKEELIDFLNEYVEGIRNFFVSGFDSSFFNSLYEFIK